jgi:D-alanine-D-alanine ligase
MNDKRKTNVAVLMGGRTAEHEVSLATGRMVAAALDKSKYRVKPVVITKEGQWILPSGYLAELRAGGEGSADLLAQMRDTNPLTTGEALAKAADERPERAGDERVDVVFIAMHGPFGEDGTVQGLLEIAGLPYTGSGVLASALAMDKVKSREIFVQHGLRVPRYIVVGAREWEANRGSVLQRIVATLGVPVVTKPAALGSSVGVAICATQAELARGLDGALEYGDRAIADECIQGTEVACGVLEVTGSDEPMALAPTEIVPKQGLFFDYHCKYVAGATDSRPRCSAWRSPRTRRWGVRA